MIKKLLTKHCAMMFLALFATAWSTQAWAEIKIHVRTEGNASGIAPHLYVWNESGELLTSTWPGDQMSRTTTTSDGVTWYVMEFSEANIGAIISINGNGQTVDLTGINDNKYYAYKGNGEYYNLTNQYIIPAEANYKEGKLFVYFVNTSEWDNPKAYVYNSSENIAGTWPGGTMTKVANSDNVYLWEKESSSTPTKVIFNNNGDNTTQTSDFGYVNGGYYNASGLITTITQLELNSTNFPDPNFRAALAEKLGVNDGDIIEPNSVRVLDVSDRQISNLDGIGHFPYLEELYAQDNNITSTSTSSNINVTSNPNLKIINASNNSTLTHIAGIANCSVLEELYLDGIDFYPARQISTSNTSNVLSATNQPSLKKLSIAGSDLQSSFTMPSFPVLEYLNLSNNSSFNGFSSALNLPKLKTLILSNANLAATALNATNFSGAGGSNLEYLDVSKNTKITTLYLTDKTGLKYLDMSGCTAFDYSTYIGACTQLEHLDISDNTAFKNTWWDNLNATKQPNLRYLNLSGTTGKTNSIKSYTINFPALDTLIVNNNNTVTTLNIATHCPSIIDFADDTYLANLAINNCGLTTMPNIISTGATSLYKLDLSDNAFTDVPTTGISSLTTLVMNNNLLEDINVSESNIQYLYAQSNSFASDYTLPPTSLVGLDLGNNGFTKFTATMPDAITDEWAIDYTQTPPVTIQANFNESDGSNTTLQALHLGGNASLETVTVNGFKGLTKLASGNDMTTSAGKGLYVAGNTALKTLDISNNRIEILGQGGSLSGLSGLEELNASHNKILTLTNRSAISAPSGIAGRAVYGGGAYTAATCPNIEDLTGLKKLNLSYNLLSDSIHLAKNTELEWLDVSHNRTITERAEGLTQYYRKTTDGTFAPWKETSWKTEKDLYTKDLNDTIGLRMLDLFYQTNLKYLDISYTNIENTAMSRFYINNRQGPESLSSSTTSSSAGVSVGRWGVPRFVLVNHCTALEEFHSNYNAMKSLGVGVAPASYSDHDISGNQYYGAVTGCPNLKVLEAIECRGQDPKIMQGEITISVRNPNIEYYNVKNSDFDKVNPYISNENGTSGQYLKTLIVDGNYTKDNASEWNLTDAGTLDVIHNPKLVNLQANRCPNLITVKANGLADLDIVSLTQDATVTTVNNETVTTKLANLYVDHDAILDEVLGLETLSALSVYHANDSHFTGEFVMPAAAKSTLTDLRVGNDKLSYAETRNNLTAVNLTGYYAVQHLETQNNPSVAALDITGFKNSLAYIDFANNHIDNDGIGIGNLSELPALTYFSCSNDSKWSESAGNSLTDLILTQSTGIQQIYANCNDLHKITGSFSNLTNIEFAHNHINGIDLSAAPNATVNSEDNGRTILADCSKFTPHGDFGNVMTVYFFQIDPNETTGNGTLLTDRDSKDSKNNIRYLGTDGLNLGKITEWTSDAAVLTNSNSKGTIDPSNMSQYLDADDVPGTIVVLDPINDDGNSANGQAKYAYSYSKNADDSDNNATFYLNWSSDGTVTGINSVIGDDGFDLAGTYGGIVVAGKDGTVVGVYDTNGRQIASETISGGKLTIDGLSPGIYIVNGNKVLVK